MPPLGVVEHLDVLHDAGAGLGAREVVLVVDQLLLDRAFISHHSVHALLSCVLCLFCWNEAWDGEVPPELLGLDFGSRASAIDVTDAAPLHQPR